MYAEDEYVDLLCADVVHTYGALCFNGASLMNDETGTTGYGETDHWNIFGDPSLQLYTATPTTMTVAHADTISFGQPTFPVSTGVRNALAAISNNGELLGYAYTNNQGQKVDETVWFRVSVFGKMAESCNQYLKKGSKVLVEGRLVPDKGTGGPRIWTNQEGKPASSFEVSAVTVRFLSSRGEVEESSGPGYQTADPSLSVAEDDTIPF